jgi:hypothetical protein
MTQRQIDAAYRRSLKTVYKHLTRPQYRLVKLLEQIEQNDKDIREIERHLIATYGPDWRKLPYAPQWEDYRLYMYLNLNNITLAGKVSRLEDKYSLDSEEVLAFHNKMNQMHSAAMVGAVSL